MERAFFEPWIGSEYQKTRLLILGESAYGWKEGMKLEPSHPRVQVQHWMENFGEQPFFREIGRALCGKKSPDYEELERAWGRCAYTIFVQTSVGFGPRNRPTRAQWEHSQLLFPEILRSIDPLPRKVVVTGKTMWNNWFPPFDGPHLCDDLQAYRFEDGQLVWCLAVPHPRAGFNWERNGRGMRAFVEATFPSRE
jgi:hypothetical protein